METSSSSSFTHSVLIPVAIGGVALVLVWMYLTYYRGGGSSSGDEGSHVQAAARTERDLKTDNSNNYWTLHPLDQAEMVAAETKLRRYKSPFANAKAVEDYRNGLLTA